MKNRGEKIIDNTENDDATMDFVSRQAQEAILNPNLPEPYKDEVVRAVVGTLLRIADKRNDYYAGRAGNRQVRKPHVSYKREDRKGEKQENIPRIIVELNGNLKTNASDGAEDLTVEKIAERAGISRNILYEWVRAHAELLESLGHIKTDQGEDPFKSETAEDARVAALMITIFLMEQRAGHHK